MLYDVVIRDDWKKGCKVYIMKKMSKEEIMKWAEKTGSDKVKKLYMIIESR